MAMDTNILPAADDLAGWKAVQSLLDRRVLDRLLSSQLVTPAVLRQYFGRPNAEYLLDQYVNVSVEQAFLEWVIHDYRPMLRQDRKGKGKGKGRKRHRKPARRGKTLAERMLASGLPAAEAALLEACAAAHPSLLRIIDVEPGVSLTVEDILLGGEWRVHDRMLSGCVEAGQCLTGRVYPAGGFCFFCPMGPLLPNILALEAADYLESQGVEFTREGLLREAHKFGRLWDWWDDRSAEGYMPQLRNTDGEELIFHTASFTIEDEPAVRQALAAREDIEFEDEDEAYVWFRDQGEEAVLPGDTLNLGRIRLLPGELVLEVNSAERLQAARQWLEQIPGVKLLGVQTRDLDEALEDRPPDDAPDPGQRVEVTPEMGTYLQEHFHQYYMQWLDAPLPALEGKSPRQACRTKAGRQKVAMLIRTIPRPVGNAGVSIEIPRQEMLRSLGLESE